MNLPKQPVKTRKSKPQKMRLEFSRLEIAALFYAADIIAGNIDTARDADMCPLDALSHADALIAASKEK